MPAIYRTDALRFPRIGYFLQHFLPQLPGRSHRTWRAFLAHCSMSESRARDSLRWGGGPQLRFTDTYLHRTLAAQFVGGANPRATAIWLRSSLAQALENDWARWQARLRLEALVLHEMTHWGDWTEDETMAAHETGEAFERAAYAGFQPVRWGYDQVVYPSTLEFQAPPVG